ncbi:MAG: NAD(P)/FAD-dependent oxidoreductase [Bdellovibrionota bacterium]
MPQSPPHAVILGAGFAGLYAAKALKNAPLRVTVVDRQNHHLFQPLLYQVATAGLSAPDIAAPIRKVLRNQKNTAVLLGDAARIDAAGRKVILKDGEIFYDYLLVATGATHSYFGKNEWAPYAPGLKTLDDALEIRRRVLLAFEAAEREEDDAKRQEWMTFVVIGAGPTGVELAGALCEISRHTLAREFRRIDPKKARIVLLEGTPRVLPPYVPELSEKARAQLERLGAEVLTGKMVTKVDGQGVEMGGEKIPARTILWAAGVAASPLGASLGAPLDRAGRVRVEKDLSVPGHPEIFVAGDLVSLDQGGKPVPGVAPAAIQEGKHAAKNILRHSQGKESIPFRYLDKGQLATIGRKAAVADLKGLHLSGFIAWAAWLLIHIFFLIGFRNRFVVLFEWAWAYATYQRSARVIWGKSESRGSSPASKDAGP